MGPYCCCLNRGTIDAFVKKFDKRNTAQHGANMEVLQSIEGKVDKIDERLEGHIDWHYKGAENDL